MLQKSPSESERIEEFSASIVKQWVKDDMDKTMSWLQSQEEQVKIIYHFPQSL